MPEFVWIQEVVFPLLGMGIGIFVLFNGFRIAKHSIDRHHERELAKAQAEGRPEDLAQLTERVERLEELGYRLQDVEERLDFTERVLAQLPERGQRDGGAQT
jgi:divalent metal cation (Fe/Co/Zn/Cd) transporter